MSYGYLQSLQMAREHVVKPFFQSRDASFVFLRRLSVSLGSSVDGSRSALFPEMGGSRCNTPGCGDCQVLIVSPDLGCLQTRSEEEEDVEDGATYQLEMMRSLREVNVDNNTVGWYQSTYMGAYQSVELIDTFLQYQVSRRTVEWSSPRQLDIGGGLLCK